MVFGVKKISTKEILSGLKELRDGMKKDKELDKMFSEVLEDAEMRIRSCEWRDFVKDKPKEDVKAVFKYSDEYNDIKPCPWVKDFSKQEEEERETLEEDGWEHQEGELLWKPFEVEHKLDFDTVWKGICELEDGMDKDEFLRNRYSNLIANIRERINSGEWHKLHGISRSIGGGIAVIYKAHVVSDWWKYGTSWYDGRKERILNLNLIKQEDCEAVWWKPLEVEEIV